MATTRRATTTDLPFMVHVLRHAAGGESEPLDVEECRTNPAIAHYIDGWTPDQIGMICLVDGSPIGAAWLRDLPASDPGYGFVAPGIPELTIAISPQQRSQGHGGYLLDSLLDECRRHGIRSVSLNVDTANEPAMAIYRKAGFVEVSSKSNHLTMLHVDGNPALSQPY
ncbi:GNAT family N-acetyltransferase [Cutibacterium avidum]|uniref:GNAT family N-acetyltransferase n=1 Tax=Cutibacterium avidum TaxID=33010 RepID=UPI0008F5D89A|nr:GNAT family N-acetyltransferase [Cutibacterium avidum]MDK7699544.1 GNAT family N-acetyltransferase [Cutibacterium avidum]OIJ75431.1 GNAT family acetyltransferase [Cutibacterium avidum]